MKAESPKAFRLPTILRNRTLPNKLLLFGTAVLLALGVANLLRYAQRVNSIDYLSKTAFSEVRAYWRTQKGLDPQERWWPLFWPLSQKSEQADVRERAANIALTMLANLEQWDKVEELAATLQPEDSTDDNPPRRMKTRESTPGSSFSLIVI